jgi:hypothetical protein
MKNRTAGKANVAQLLKLSVPHQGGCAFAIAPGD